MAVNSTLLLFFWSRSWATGYTVWSDGHRLDPRTSSGSVCGNLNVSGCIRKRAASTATDVFVTGVCSAAVIGFTGGVGTPEEDGRYKEGAPF